MNLEELRKVVRKRLEAKKKEQERLIEPDPPPLYDEVFWHGLQEIDDDFFTLRWSDIVNREESIMKRLITWLRLLICKLLGVNSL